MRLPARSAIEEHAVRSNDHRATYSQREPSSLAEQIGEAVHHFILFFPGPGVRDFLVWIIGKDQCKHQ